MGGQRGPRLACCWALVLAGLLSPGACASAPPYCPRDDGDASSDASDDGPGAIRVTGTYTNATCPEVNPIGIGPDSGGVVMLTATVAGGPPDGSTLSFTWMAPTGSFTDPLALDTSYRCPGAGVIAVTLTATAGVCQNQTIALVMCQMAYSGPL
jgi:hypothetical protein